jgi:hypothetical protein
MGVRRVFAGPFGMYSPMESYPKDGISKLSALADPIFFLWRGKSGTTVYRVLVNVCYIHSELSRVLVLGVGVECNTLANYEPIVVDLCVPYVVVELVLGSLGGKVSF